MVSDGTDQPVFKRPRLPHKPYVNKVLSNIGEVLHSADLEWAGSDLSSSITPQPILLRLSPNREVSSLSKEDLTAYHVLCNAVG